MEFLPFVGLDSQTRLFPPSFRAKITQSMKWDALAHNVPSDVINTHSLRAGAPQRCSYPVSTGSRYIDEGGGKAVFFTNIYGMAPRDLCTLVNVLPVRKDSPNFRWKLHRCIAVLNVITSLYFTPVPRKCIERILVRQRKSYIRNWYQGLHLLT